MNRISLRDVPRMVRYRDEFKCNESMYSCNNHGDGASAYIVYSYGPHFPVAVYANNLGRWFYNKDKYSSTTSRHQSKVREGIDHYTELNTEQIKLVARAAGNPGYILHTIGNDLRDLVANAPLIEALTGKPVQL